MSQFNIWNWPLEDYFIENAAECRSDLLGNMVEWNSGNWFTGQKVRGERGDITVLQVYRLYFSLEQSQGETAVRALWEE